ncbi:acetyl-CoA carboxylase biotin carboxyl carrier protein [Pseudonocardia ailaonensis]|uniref:Biotin carboxyl carrier protein of acetyl-CoA carboxylase n=1 Tax=Pseudonocardia ailaonensis TaxID=367279 RepID=A0ABN2MHQ0_9PSEU
MTEGREQESFGYTDALEMLRLVEQDDRLEKIDLRVGRFRVKLDRGPRPAGDLPPVRAQATAEPATEEEPAAVPGEEVAAGELVTASIAGVFYVAPSPGASPFVEVGTRVEVGQTVGIIEVMKLMNTVTATAAGIVDRVLVQDGQLVQFGAPLVALRPADPR